MVISIFFITRSILFNPFSLSVELLWGSTCYR